MLTTVIGQLLRPTEPPNVDLTTGICKRVYEEGKLGDYHVDTSMEEVARFESRLIELDPTWDREKGDAVIVVATGVPTTSWLPE